MTTTAIKLTGQSLLDYVNSNQTLTRVELCTGAGYYPNYTAFYEAILDARNDNGEYTSPANSEYNIMNGRDWYEDVLDDQGRALYDMIENTCPEFSKLDANEWQQFMDELSEHGINTAEDFESAYFYTSDSWNAECEFAQYYAEEINCLDVTNDAGYGSFLVIDWQATWDRNLSYDFFNIEFVGETYFFSSNF